jgi:hypothetical protein
MGETEQVLSRFYGALVDEIRAQRPDYLTGPFTVAEIYQNLVPYGVHRDRIGVEMNGDYEDALLRLLAGEGGYLILESDTALRNLREELESPNPNTGLYREYAAVGVRLNADRLDGQAADSSEVGMTDSGSLEPESVVDIGIFTATGSEAAEEGTGAEPESDGEPGRTSEADGEPVSSSAPLGESESASGLDGEPLTACRWCRADLPRRDTLNFCPFCGTDINIVPCGQCGEELEPEWRFCAACGAEAQA